MEGHGHSAIEVHKNRVFNLWFIHFPCFGCFHVYPDLKPTWKESPRVFRQTTAKRKAMEPTMIGVKHHLIQCNRSGEHIGTSYPTGTSGIIA
jgi:hypothetical protein